MELFCFLYIVYNNEEKINDFPFPAHVVKKAWRWKQERPSEEWWMKSSEREKESERESYLERY